MKKVMLALVAAAAMVAGLISPAHAVSNNLSCSYSNPNHTNMAGFLRVTNSDSDTTRLEVHVEVTSDPANRQWLWSIYHNGDSTASDSGEGWGTFARNTTVINWQGTDSIRLHIENGADTVNCNATVNF